MTGGWAARCAVVLGNIARTEKVQTEKVPANGKGARNRY
jgi:hypothetical protein